ncbi:unnamed protein product [Rotaria sp. Silwood1]|nr:unnamed protein product [Rotaria sp. Silwood1]
MIAEVRLSWLLLFLLIISAVLKQYEVFHTITWPMIFILTAQVLYINACMKGEECIPVTWDIFYEKWGWMLIYWNLAGVPFVYAFQAYYILVNSLRTQKPNENVSMTLIIILFIVLILAYYIWDSSLSQKIRFPDICMATCWALSCHQWTGVLPYFYPIFFFFMIVHRYTRDMARCQAKYGKDWKTYCERVPYAFIPGLI